MESATKRLARKALPVAVLATCLALTAVAGTSVAKQTGKGDKVTIKGAPSSIACPNCSPVSGVPLQFKVKGVAKGSLTLWILYTYNKPCKSTAKAENAADSTESANGQSPATVKGKFSKQGLASVESSGKVDLCVYLAKGTPRNIKATVAKASKVVPVTS